MATNTLAGTDIYRLLNEEVSPVLIEMMQRFQKESQLFAVKKGQVSGKYYIKKAITEGNFRMGGRGEGQFLPGMNPDTSYQDEFAGIGSMESRWKRRYLYTGVDLTGPMREAPKSKSGGFENLAQLVTKMTIKNIPEMASRKWAVGQSGILGQVHSVSKSGGDVTVTLVPADAGGTGGATTSADAAPWAGNRYIREGTVVDITNSSAYGGWANALRTGTDDRFRKVTAVSSDGDTATVSFEDSAGCSVDQYDLLVEAGTRAATGISAASDYEDNLYDPLGLPDAIQDGSDPVYSLSYYGNNLVSSYPQLQSVKLDAGAGSALAAWSPQLINRLFEKISVDPRGGGEPDFLYCTPSVFREGSNFLTATVGFTDSSTNNPRSGVANENPVRYMNPGAKPTIGITGINVNVLGSSGSKTFFTSPFAPHYRMYAVAKGTLEVLQEKPAGFMQDDGQTLRWVTGKDEFAILWKWYTSGITCDHPRKNGYIVGLSGDHNN